MLMEGFRVSLMIETESIAVTMNPCNAVLIEEVGEVERRAWQVRSRFSHVREDGSCTFATAILFRLARLLWISEYEDFLLATLFFLLRFSTTLRTAVNLDATVAHSRPFTVIFQT